MSSLTDDINTARQAGTSDDDILAAYKAYDPAKAADIDAALSSGRSTSDVLGALGAYDALYGNNTTNQGVAAQTTGALQQGVASELTGLGNTAKETLGPGIVSGTLSSLGKAVAPSGYQSASEGLGDTTKGIADRAGYIPRAMAEGAPGLATDLVAGAAGARVGGAVGLLGGPLAEVTVPAGAAIGGALGFGGSYLARNYGSDAEAAAQARTGMPDTTPDAEDKTRALAAGVASAALSRVGVTKALGATVGDEAGSTALAAMRTLAKATAADAGTSAASDALNTAIVDRQDPLSDPSGLALAAGQGALAGAGFRAVTGIGDLTNTIKFRDIDPANGDALATLYNGRDFSTPAKAYKAVSDVDSLLDMHADHWAERTQPQLDALAEGSGYTDDTDLLLKSVRQTLAGGNVVDPTALETLRQRLGDWHEGSGLVDTLQLQNTQNQVKAVGNFRDGPNGTGTFGGGISDTALGRKVLAPWGKFGKVGVGAIGADLGVSALLPSVSLHPAIAAALGATQVGAYLGAKGLDAVLRNTNPLAEFTQRFGLGDPADSEPKPAFAQQLAIENEIGDLARQSVLRQRALGAAQGNPLPFASSSGASTPEGNSLRQVRVGDQVVSFDPSTVTFPDRYAASIQRRMSDRMDAVEAAKNTIPQAYHHVLDTLHTTLTHNSNNSREVAYGNIEDAVNSLPPEYQSGVMDSLNTPKLWASFQR